MIRPLLFHRFQGIWLGALVAESIAGTDLNSDLAVTLRWNIMRELAARGHGIWDGAIADWGGHFLNAADWIRATLPLAFFFHDEPEHWVDRLASILALAPETWQALQTWAKVVAKILMCPQDSSRNLPNPVPNFLEPRVELPVASLPDPLRAIAIAQGYCADFPHHFRLAVLLSLRGTQSPEIACLTGSLMGGRLGVWGIPHSWLSRPAVASLLPDSYRLLQSLWMQWLGCSHLEFNLEVVGAISTATTLQPRPRLALVSQTSLLCETSSRTPPIS